VAAREVILQVHDWVWLTYETPKVVKRDLKGANVKSGSQIKRGGGKRGGWGGGEPQHVFSKASNWTQKIRGKSH